MTIEFPDDAWPKLKAALQHIADHPAEFYMPSYVLTIGGPFDASVRYRVQDRTGYPFPACGTVACLAGRIVLNDDPDRIQQSIGSGAALRALGLPAHLSVEDDEYEDELSYELDRVFQATGIQNYAQLKDALLERFTFPEPMPEPSA